MHLVIDKNNVILASAADAAGIEWFEGYGVAPGGVSIIGGKDAFKLVDAPAVTGDVLGLLFVKGKAVAPVLSDPEPPTPVVDDSPFELFKTTVLNRMTDEEVDAFDFELSTSTARERRMWTDCDRLVSTDQFFEALKARFAKAFGADRAALILAR